MSEQQQTTPNAELTEIQRLREEKKKAKQDKKKELKNKAAAKGAKQQPKKEEANKDDKKKGKFQKTEFVNTTPPGEKKDLSVPMAKSYDPMAVESAWYAWWEKKKFFNPDYVAPGKTLEEVKKKEPFVIVIPPPNVTGSLHMGHGLTNAIEDSICRWHRMNGKAVLWVPGVDHAGIATQSVVEKRLKTEGLTRLDLGREKFIERTWQWKNQYGDRISTQLKRMGSSLDWSREVFTMDEKRNVAVIEAFVRFYDAGIIYRDNRLVNWSCALRTAISDIECDSLEIDKPINISVPGHNPTKKYSFGYLWKFAYKVKGSDQKIIVATTRPETMLGDTAVAVHPEDPRYKDLHGKFLEHPFISDREIPVVCDDKLVDMSFGTGAVKITPGHDPNDYEVGKKHNLKFINILNDDGTMNDLCGEFKGMMRFDAREAVLKKLEEKQLYEGKIVNPMRIMQCSRSGDIIEPIMKPQWWSNVDDLAKKAVDAVKNGELKLIPQASEKQWFHYLENIRPWCISRQLWWGHRIPAYLIVPKDKSPDQVNQAVNDSYTIGRNLAEAKERAAKKLNLTVEQFDAQYTLHQDPDVLDTWFSSGLFPFSVMGWPEETEDFKRFYPTQLLETGKDILFFWVARMVMMGLQLTGKLPFSEVFLHSIVRDSIGRKMSKSLGNVIDPLDVIEGISLESMIEELHKGNLDKKEIDTAIKSKKKEFPNGIDVCGADAIRFGLCAYLQQGRDINLEITRIESYRHFCNKLWNAYTLSMMYLGKDYKHTKESTGKEGKMDKWILHRLNQAITNANKSFKEYELGNATSAIYSFWLYDFCDIYLETTKPTMFVKDGPADADAQEAVRCTIYKCVDEGLRLISPFMPFLSEELWQRLPRREGDLTESICVAEYPKEISERKSDEIDGQVASIMKIVRCIRAMLTTYNINKKFKPTATLNTHNEETKTLYENFKNEIVTLSYIGKLEITLKASAPTGCAIDVPEPNTEVYLHLTGIVDFAQEAVRLEKKLEENNLQIKALNDRMKQADYEKVPDNVKANNTEKLEALEKEVKVLETAIGTCKDLVSQNK